VSSSGIGAGGNTAQGAKLPGEAGNQGAVQEWLPQPGGGRASWRLIACERARIEPILSKRIEVYINLLYPCCDDRRNRGGVLFGRNKMAMFIIESEINYFDPKK
jgi:hypothetical protein